MTAQSLDCAAISASAASRSTVGQLPAAKPSARSNGDLPRAAAIREEAPLSSAGTLGRLLGRLPHDRSSSLLDLDTPARATPFAAARTHFAREGTPGLADALSRGRDAGDVSLGDNTVTGEPLKLKPLPQPSQEADPPSSPAPDEIERILTNRGFRYRPDPMGRLGEGDWIDANGRVLSAIDRDRALGNSRHNEVGSASTDPSEVGRPSVTIEIDDDEDDAENGSHDPGGAEPANFFDRVLQGVFGRKSKDAWVRKGKLPAKVKERVDQIKNERTRRAVEALLDRTDDETENKGHAISALKRTGKYGAQFDFGRLMARVGKNWRDAKPFNDKETGRIAGRSYVTEDGVEIKINYLDPKNRERGTNVEVRIPKPQGSGYRSIKVRYRETEVIRGKRPSSR